MSDSDSADKESVRIACVTVGAGCRFVRDEFTSLNDKKTILEGDDEA